MLIVHCSSISTTLELPNEVQSALQALVGAGCPRHLQLGPQNWPGECDCPELTWSRPRVRVPRIESS